MVVSKTLLSSLCLALWASVASAKTDSLEDLKAKCEEFTQNQQLQKFGMKVECSGRYTYFTETKKTFTLPNESKMNAQTTTKSGLFQTEEKEFLKEVAAYEAPCSVWEKKEMLAPEGMGIPVAITSCDQLTAEFVQNRCDQELKDYCEDNFVASAKDAGKNTAAGMCTLSTVEVVDTCSMLNN